MNVYTIALLFGALAVPALGGMWFAWRARARRDAAVAETAAVPGGELIASFPRVGYVSTTPAGSPFERVAIPGLRYKGDAEVAVRRDGVAITVTGEPTVGIPAERVLGSGTASGRVGKAVERDGLSLLRWAPGATAAPAAPTTGTAELETSFRFSGPAEQLRFAEAVAQLAGPAPTKDTHHTTQEDA